MSETQQTSDADVVGSATGEGHATVNEVETSESSSTNAVEQVDVIAKLKEATGRNYSSLDEALSHLKQMNSYVGDQTIAEQREKARLADAVISQYAQEKGINEQEAREELSGLVKPKKQVNRAQVQESSDPRIDALERKLFLAENPQAVPYIEKVSKYAKAEGVDLSSAFNELYGDVLKSQREQNQVETKRMEKMGARVTASTSSAPQRQPDKYATLMAEYKKSGDEKLFIEALKVKNGIKEE